MEERTGRADRHRRAALLREEAYGIEQEINEARQRECDRGFAAASRRLGGIEPTFWTRRLLGVTQVSFRTAAERKALARAANVPSASGVSQVTIEIRRCARLRSRLPEVRSGRVLYVQNTPSSFRSAVGYSESEAGRWTNGAYDLYHPRWTRFVTTPVQGRAAFYSPEHRSFLDVERSRLVSANGQIRYADETGPGLQLHRLGLALEIRITIIAPRDASGTLLLADQVAGELAPWLNRLDALAVVEATPWRNNHSPAG